MKLSINYDFYDAIRNVNDPLSLIKIIKNEKKKYAMLLPLDLVVIIYLRYKYNYEPGFKDIIKALLIAYGNVITIDLFFQIIAKILFHTDMYAEKSSYNLKELVLLLKEINVNTNYDLLLESELYAKKCYLEFDNGLLPSLKSEKYIYVPSYDFNGEETVTSILQEHYIGTKEYTLSVGEPKKQERLVLAKNHI